MNLRILIPTLALVVASCGGGSDGVSTPLPPPPTQNPVQTVQVGLAATSLTPGATTQATATLRDAGGGTLTGRAVSWSSSNSGVATVSASGVVTAVATGSASIMATSEGKSGSASLTVAQPAVNSVTLVAGQQTLTPGLSTAVTATLKDASGNVLTGRSITWASSNTGAATVDNTGLVIGVATGSTTISATSEGKTGTVGITISAPTVAEVSVTPSTAGLVVGQGLTLAAAARDAGGTVLQGRTVTWQSSNVAVATVSAGGQVLAVATGSASITATVDGISGAAQISVSATPVASVTLSVANVTIPVGEIAVVTATPRDINSNPLTDRVVNWTSTNLSIVNGYVYDNVAVITGIAVGSATVTATAEGKSASIPVTIIAPPSGSVCSQIAGALIYGSDNQYLGRLTNRFDSQSTFNEFGIYGSPYGAYSTNNQYGQYGSPYSSKSANNPYASSPPVLVKNGTAIAYYTVNTTKSPRVSPAYAATCNFP